MRSLREWFIRLSESLRPWRRTREREDELRAHLDLAVEAGRASGLSPEAAARAARLRVGGLSQAMDAVHDQRGLPWVDALAADLRYGWRQVLHHRTASATAVLSLGLAVGAAMAAFELVDAVLLRPLPVAEPHRLFMAALVGSGTNSDDHYRDDLDYPEFRDYAEASRTVADSLLIGFSSRVQVTFDGAAGPERLYRQYVSGNLFPTFGLAPAAGRLIAPTDDVTPGAHAVAVLGYDLWTRRFANDPAVVGRHLRIGSISYQVIGVAPRGFTGTEPGRLTDLYTPSTMNVQALSSPGWSWFRLWVRPKNGATPEQVRDVIQAQLTRRNAERAKPLPADTPRANVEALLAERVTLLPAGGGTSGLQRTFRTPLLILVALVSLVLLIACGNVANILATRALARSREMALRISIGAGRARLVQMLLVESFVVAVLASVAGVLFAWWSAPFVVSLLAVPEDPVRLVLGGDIRTVGFGLLLTVVVTLVLGVAPVLRASVIRPVLALKGTGEGGSHRRLTGTVVTLQMAFSVFVLSVAVLFGATFTRLVNRPTGYSDENVVLLDAQVRAKTGTAADWARVLDDLRAVPGVASAAAAGWVPLSDSRWRGSVRTDPGGQNVETHFLQVSPGYFDTEGIGLVDGREFERGDVPPSDQVNGPQGSLIVNEALAKAAFGGANPVGRQLFMRQDNNVDAALTVVGLVRDTVYYRLRDRMPPTAYLPMGGRSEGTFLVRAKRDALAVVPLLRQRVTQADPDFQVGQAMPQRALVTRQVIRERLLATLSAFFAGVGLLVAVVGLYGVLNAAVQQRQREIGIRLALGARAAHVIANVTLVMIALVACGAALGMAGGVAFGRLVASLLFEVTSTDVVALATPLAVLGVATMVAALPPVVRALRLDPVRVVRGE
jgi:predicted permease